MGGGGWLGLGLGLGREGSMSRGESKKEMEESRASTWSRKEGRRVEKAGEWVEEEEMSMRSSLKVSVLEPRSLLTSLAREARSFSAALAAWKEESERGREVSVDASHARRYRKGRQGQSKRHTFVCSLSAAFSAFFLAVSASASALKGRSKVKNEERNELASFPLPSRPLRVAFRISTKVNARENSPSPHPSSLSS